MNQVKRLSLADQAADLLLARIKSGEWPVGTKLPGETTLAPQLGVGRSTVREATRQLAGRGILLARQGSGVFVNSVDEASAEWDLVLKRAHIKTVLEARLAVEGEAAELAAMRRTPADVEAIQIALRFRAERRFEVSELVDADIAFHRSIVAASHNEILLSLFDTMTPRLRSAMIEMLYMADEFGDDPDHQAHANVVEAICGRDANRARALTRAHLHALSSTMGSTT
ncbi:FadR/GntR family transcriptional regulator [Rhodococcus sp. H29-C3]|uniref:FadR/GntR family transcriptional regulator n=1 Tax=Rhodococcus sp. H29-C3 TaxID=3046307 RepID=UPI0024BB9733|nr:FadR/GntR family transcriptional regulator [Rhodococcus sp. H29-C3]MDJ0363408.1 FadR/GntR family transcriptional regulator [Rhodococcus sp. H29-C3]